MKRKPGCENPHFSWRAKDRESFAKGAAIDGFSGKIWNSPHVNHREGQATAQALEVQVALHKVLGVHSSSKRWCEQLPCTLEKGGWNFEIRL